MTDTSARPTLEDLQALQAGELRDLAAEIVGIDPASPSPDGRPWLIDAQAGKMLAVATGTPTRPLLDLSQPALAATAASAGVGRAFVVTTVALEASEQARLEALLQRITSASGVTVTATDASELLTSIRASEGLRARYFPTEAQAEERVRDTAGPQAERVVRTLLHVAPSRPAALGPGVGRLVFTAAALVLLVAIPLRVDAYHARWISSVSLGLLALGMLLSAAAVRHFGPPAVGAARTALIGRAFPLLDQQTLARRLTRSSQLTTGRLVWTTVLTVVVRLVRFLVPSAVLVFFLGFAGLYLLLWGLDPAACTEAGKSCGAFVGAGTRPSVGDFAYVAIQVGFLNSPGDLAVSSRVARAALVGEFVTAAAVLANYAATFGLDRGLWFRRS